MTQGMNILSYIFPWRLLLSGSRYNKKIDVRLIRGKNVLLVNGIQQTGPYTERLWKEGLAQYPDVGTLAKILVLGVGGGTLFHLFHNKYPESKIVGVDIDAEIIRIAGTFFGVNSLPNVTLIQRDAREFISDSSYKNYFDFVVIDLYIGNDVPDFVTTEKFFKKVRTILRPNGRLVVNYFSESNQPQKAKKINDTLASIFSETQSRGVLRNIFFYVIK